MCHIVKVTFLPGPASSSAENHWLIPTERFLYRRLEQVPDDYHSPDRAQTAPGQLSESKIEYRAGDAGEQENHADHCHQNRRPTGPVLQLPNPGCYYCADHC